MPSLKQFLRSGASTAASGLEATAGLLRGFSGGGHAPPRAERPAPDDGGASASAPPVADPAATPRGTKPASGTRTRIANPKAARKVRSREG